MVYSQDTLDDVFFAGGYALPVTDIGVEQIATAGGIGRTYVSSPKACGTVHTAFVLSHPSS